MKIVAILLSHFPLGSVRHKLYMTYPWGVTHQMKIEVIYINPGLPGYQPVFYMARLAAKCFDTELVVLPPPKSPSIAEILSSLRPLRKHGAACVLICPQPGNLVSAFMLERLREKYGHIVAWVFDSFWLKYVPRVVRLAGIFDQIFVTELEDLVSWRAMLRAPVDWLPWGADALRLGSSTAKRPLDLLRFGRQPPEWEDDIATERICDSMQLHFSGRPPYFENENDNEQTLMKKLGQTKFTLSFSNNVSPGTQTHPDRQYLTARWTDALSAGATVAGIPPKSE